MHGVCAQLTSEAEMNVSIALRNLSHSCALSARSAAHLRSSSHGTELMPQTVMHMYIIRSGCVLPDLASYAGVLVITQMAAVVSGNAADQAVPVLTACQTFTDPQKTPDEKNAALNTVILRRFPSSSSLEYTISCTITSCTRLFDVQECTPKRWSCRGWWSYYAPR